MMARFRTFWTGVFVLLTAGLPAVVRSFSHLSFNLCKWCEVSSPECKDSICFSNCSLSSFCTVTEEICIAMWRKTNDTMTVHTMCHNPAVALEGVDPGLLLNFTTRECHMVPQPAEDGAMMVCGCHGDHECNDKLIFKGANGFSKLQSKDVVPVVVVSLVPPVLVAIVATAAFYFYRTRRPNKPGPPARPDWPTKRTPELYQAFDLPCGGAAAPGSEESNTKVPNNDLINDMADRQGQLNEQLPIKLEAVVGKGRFAEVWRACLLQGEKGGVSSYDTVAVKVFPAVEYASWRNEVSIFSDPKLEHDNVVRFLAAEGRGPPGHAHRKYWLVLAYHSLGNLQDFLAANVLSWEELVAMAGSIARGLAHLHSDTTPSGLQKVPVAHRDLKSSNIVVKSRKECALCDFGLALKLDLSLTVDDYANSGQVGTARYMAPEVLESRVNLEDLEAFKQMDVYSMALVLWEMASRCHAIGEVKSYEPAFGSKVCEQPCVDSMRDLVLRDRGRPDIPSAWTQHQGMSVFCSTITECWDHDPEARLTAHCVVERLNALQQEEEEEERLNALQQEEEEEERLNALQQEEEEEEERRGQQEEEEEEVERRGQQEEEEEAEERLNALQQEEEEAEERLNALQQEEEEEEEERRGQQEEEEEEVERRGQQEEEEEAEEEEEPRQEALREEDGGRGKDSETPDNNQIPSISSVASLPSSSSSSSSSSVQSRPEVSHDSLVHTGSAV
ncbi:TGF-beta receptor type-2-like [Pempheris klunzingeri]|uniref:TGF-beta receptor type-2-like n=1 Tax=Pempheris klunzingeri TaxID=3127111 RepID=UPI003981279A